MNLRLTTPSFAVVEPFEDRVDIDAVSQFEDEIEDVFACRKAVDGTLSEFLSSANGNAVAFDEAKASGRVTQIMSAIPSPHAGQCHSPVAALNVGQGESVPRPPESLQNVRAEHSQFDFL